MELNVLYRSILQYAGLEADSDGLVSINLDSKKQPAVIGGRRLVLPTQQHLRTANVSEKVIFHPLAENILRGESEVLTKLMEIINIRLNYTFGIVGQSLLNLIASPELHRTLDPDQQELLIAISDVDETTLKRFISLMLEFIKKNPEAAFLNIYLKRGGSTGGKRYSRAGIVVFKMYEELKKDPAELMGVPLRVKDREAFRRLYQFIFPNIEDPMAYNRGSDSDVAPYLDALMKTSMALASRFNDILTQYADYIDDGEKLMFDSDWVDTFTDLGVMKAEIRKVPMQAGNEGSESVEERSTPGFRPEIVRPQLPVPQTTVPAPAPTTQYSPPTPMFQQQQPAQQRPEVRTTNRGLDFNSIKAAMMTPAPYPAMAPAMAPAMQPAMAVPWGRPMGAPMQFERQPSWATPGTPFAGTPAMMPQNPGYGMAPQLGYAQPMMPMGGMQWGGGGGRGI